MEDDTLAWELDGSEGDGEGDSSAGLWSGTTKKANDYCLKNEKGSYIGVLIHLILI